MSANNNFICGSNGFTIKSGSFDIRQWVEYNSSGRAACPSCVSDGKTRQKNLSIDLITGAYRCWRGCSVEQIRQALGAPKSTLRNSFQVYSKQTQSETKVKPQTISKEQVLQSQQRLLNEPNCSNSQALAWLEGRGFTLEIISFYRLGLEKYWLSFNQDQSSTKKFYWAIAIHIPASKPDQFYRKLRIAPWLADEARPDDLPRWSQYGVPTTIFYTYCPKAAEATWFCEGEWDAIRLGALAQQLQVNVAVCCSTAGCGTVPRQEDLDQLLGEVFIFFDRNDQPIKNGIIPGEEGARKLAMALEDRGKVALVPMPAGCDVRGWDISNALDAGFGWADFEAAAQTAITPVPSTTEDQTILVTLRDRILTLLDQNEIPSDRKLALMELSRELGYQYRDIDSLAKSLIAEEERQYEQVDATRKLRDLLQTRQTSLDLKRYLDWLGDVLEETAQAMSTTAVFLFTTLLPVAASLIGTGARIVIKPSAKYTQPMVFWCAIVANSGSIKTPAQRIILDPLIALETQAYERFQIELEDYQASIDSERGKKQNIAAETPSRPSRRRYLTKDSTLETLQRLHSENPRGILYYRDELAGVVKCRNQYRGGYGADEEAELDQWNGSAVIVDRAEKSICMPSSAISRTGAIQWDVLANLMGDHQDFNGAWSRWLFCAVDAPPRYLQLLQEDQDTRISEALTNLYLELEKIPQQDYLLSFEAKRLFQTWQHQLVDSHLAEDALGLQLVYPKIEAYTARLALWLNIVNAVLRGKHPSQVIDSETMEKAIELAAFYLWQYRLIYAHNSPESGITALSLKIQEFAERIEKVTASRLKSGIRDLRKTSTEQIRELMKNLANAGYGFIEGSGADLVYIPISRSQQKKPYSSPPTPQNPVDSIDTEMMAKSISTTQAEQRLNQSVDTIDFTERINSGY